MVTVARCLQAARATNAGGCSQMGCCFGCDRATLLREKPLIIPGDTPFRMPSCRCAASARGLLHCAQRASFSSLTRRQSSNFSARRRWHAGKWLRRRPRSATPHRPAAQCGCAGRPRLQRGRNALPFVAHDPGARPGQCGAVQKIPCVRAGHQQRHMPARAGRPREPLHQVQRKMRAHARAQHLGRPQRRTALERQHLPKAKRRALRRMEPTLPASCTRSSTTVATSRLQRPARGRSTRKPMPAGDSRPLMSANSASATLLF
jgi:hypothetical protein